MTGLEGAEACPHCGGVTVTEAHPVLRWACGACGGPRVAGVSTAALSDDAVRALKRARKERATSIAAQTGRIAAIVGTLMTWSLVAMTIVWAHAALPAMALAVVGGVATACTIALGRIARRAARDSRDALDEAWAAAARRLLEARGGAMTAPEIAHAMRMTEPDAERVLAHLSVLGAHVRVGDDAELTYDVASTNEPDERRAQR